MDGTQQPTPFAGITVQEFLFPIAKKKPKQKLLEDFKKLSNICLNKSVH